MTLTIQIQTWQNSLPWSSLISLSPGQFSRIVHRTGPADWSLSQLTDAVLSNQLLVLLSYVKDEKNPWLLSISQNCIFCSVWSHFCGIQRLSPVFLKVCKLIVQPRMNLQRCCQWCCSLGLNHFTLQKNVSTKKGSPLFWCEYPTIERPAQAARMP